MERDHLGVLTGSPVTDVRITLTGGRAHAKHTEGGDFRQATYRAIRQGFMQAREAGAAVLLEPWYHFELEVPGSAWAGRSRMPRVWVPSTSRRRWRETGRSLGSRAGIRVQDYALEVAAYTSGRGHLYLSSPAMRLAMMLERVIETAAYEPEADLPNTPDSVFCSHGAGYTVKWYDARRGARKGRPATFRPGERQTPSFRPCDKGTVSLSPCYWYNSVQVGITITGLPIEEADMNPNPFKPTAGKRPPILIGRESVIEDFEEGLDNGAGAPAGSCSLRETAAAARRFSCGSCNV
ncbi:MAG: hypothetical protein ACLTYW_10625 [Collinsella sp.]